MVGLSRIARRLAYFSEMLDLADSHRVPTSNPSFAKSIMDGFKEALSFLFHFGRNYEIHPEELITVPGQR